MEIENQKIIKQFLFGEMSEENRFDFEGRFLTDSNLFDEIKVVEDELIEKYVRGWMNSAESSKFEKHFLTTTKRRERVEFSRQFINKTDEQKVVAKATFKKDEGVTAAEESIWDKLATLFRIPKIAIAGGLALIIGVFGSWVLYQNFNKERVEMADNNDNRIVTTPTPSVTIETPTNNDGNKSVNENIELPTNNNVNLQKQTDNSKLKEEKPSPTPTLKKKNVPDVKKNSAPKKTPPIQKVSPNPILALFGGTVRSNGKSNILTLPKGAKAATLQLNLESIDYKTFQAQLNDANGNVIFQRGNLKPNNTRINFSVPAKNLKRGDYIIKLFGKNDAGENESVEDYQFRVQQ